MEFEGRPVDVDKIVIARKWSLFEYDMHSHDGVSEKELREKYRQMGIEERLISSHERQLSSIEKIKTELDNPQIITGPILTKRALKKADVVIALGGDNYFQYVSHFIDRQMLIGVNSDTEKSEGALLPFTPDTLISFLPDLMKGNYSVEEWTRLQSILNGRKLPLALSEVFVGAKMNVGMSRYIMNVGSMQFEQKSSGLIVATGAGSTGWYDAAYQTAYGEPDHFAKTQRVAKFIGREMFKGHLTDSSLRHGIIHPGDELIITSLMRNGIVSTDASEKMMFPIKNGEQVKISLSDFPLKVIKKD